MVHGGRDLREFFEIFEVLGGLAMYGSYQVTTTTCLKPSHFLCIYPHKVFSACAEVRTGTWPSTVSIMAPGGRDLGDFRVSGRAGDI